MLNSSIADRYAAAKAELEAADMVCRRAAALFDNGKECGSDANIAKLLHKADFRQALDQAPDGAAMLAAIKAQGLAGIAFRQKM